MQMRADGYFEIPLEIRKKLGLKPDTPLDIQLVGEVIQIKKTSSKANKLSIVEALRGKGSIPVSTGDVMKMTREE